MRNVEGWFLLPNVQCFQEAQTAVVGSSVNYFDVRDYVFSCYSLVMDGPGMVKDGPLLGVTGNPLGETHGGHTDVRTEASSDGA